MNVIVPGVVQGGRVVPDAPLPEGARVEVRVVGTPPEVPPEMRAEFDAWGRANDRALDLIDGPAPEQRAGPIRRGEVWRVRLPAASGHAQMGDRPALVVQNDAFTAALPTALVVPFTGTWRRPASPAHCGWTRTGRTG